MSKSKPARSVGLRSARKARSKKAVGHQPQRADSKQARPAGKIVPRVRFAPARARAGKARRPPFDHSSMSQTASLA